MQHGEEVAKAKTGLVGELVGDLKLVLVESIVSGFMRHEPRFILVLIVLCTACVPRQMIVPISRKSAPTILVCWSLRCLFDLVNLTGVEEKGRFFASCWGR